MAGAICLVLLGCWVETLDDAVNDPGIAIVGASPSGRPLGRQSANMLPSIESGLFGSQCVSEDVRGRIEHTLEAGIATVQGTRIGLELHGRAAPSVSLWQSGTPLAPCRVCT